MTPTMVPAAPAAVLFDLDGVLVDSFEVWVEVVNVARRGFGFPEVDRARVAAIFGQGISDDLRNLYPGRTREEVLGAYDAAMPQAIGRMRLNPEARAVLEGLGARGIRRAVVTNTQQSLAGKVLAAVGLTHLVDTCIAVVPGLKEKPAPDLLLRALEVLAVAPGRALMVGDTEYDEAAAQAARVPFLRYELRAGTSLRAALAARGAASDGGPA